MRRGLEELARRRVLDEPSLVQDEHARAQDGEHAEVVAHHEQGHPALPLLRAQDLQHLRLHGHVERGCRLVGDEQGGLEQQRHGEEDALALTTGQFVRQTGRLRGGVGEPHALHHLHGGIAGAPPVTLAVGERHFGHLIDHAHPRVERGERLLKHDAAPTASHSAACAARRGEHLVSLKMHAAACDERWREQAQHRERERGLAAAARAEHAHGLTRRERERDVLEDPDARAARDVDAQRFDGEQGGHASRSSSAIAARRRSASTSAAPTVPLTAATGARTSHHAVVR